MNNRVKGIAAAVLSAVSYGTNPIWSKYLYADGLHPHSVLFHRFLTTIVLLALLLVRQRLDFRLTRREAGVMAMLGVLFAGSSLSLYTAFTFMDSGLACTILFVYPILVAALMALCFRERAGWMTWLALLLSVPGLLLLSSPGGGAHFSWPGFWLSMLSALTYAVYIIIVNRAHLERFHALQLTFHAMVFCLLCIVAHSFAGGPETAIRWILPQGRDYVLVLCNALVSTICPLMTLAAAVRCIGPTTTSIVGALEPVTAVVFGVILFQEAITGHIVLGIAFILVAVTLTLMGDGLRSRGLRGRLLTWRIHRARRRRVAA